MKAPILGRSTLLSDQNLPVAAYVEAMNARAAEFNPQKPLYTGRYFAVLKTGIKNFKKSNAVFQKQTGLKIASFDDFAEAGIEKMRATDADVLTYDHLGVALVGGNTEQLNLLSNDDNDFVLIPEEVVYVPEDFDFVEQPVEQRNLIAGLNQLQQYNATWGLLATNAAISAYSGKGVKIAVLDTGFDATHPDFTGRNITRASFVPGESPDDGHGHGTHCIGTACGSNDAAGLRYGVAFEADIYAGKVLSNSGSGAQQYILDGITWAVNNRVNIISMSLGSPVLPGMPYNIVYERAAQYANANGTIIVAAAGNESRRSMGVINPVGSPANCPSILAVGAVDIALNVADFSTRSINPDAQVDVVAPGVNVRSSWPMPLRYRNLNGTSMATPHVAGILGLYCEKFPTYNYQQIIAEMLKFTKRLSAPSVDVGYGLVIAP